MTESPTNLAAEARVTLQQWPPLQHGGSLAACERTLLAPCEHLAPPHTEHGSSAVADHLK